MSNEKEAKLKALKLTLDKLDKAYGKGHNAEMNTKQIRKYCALSKSSLVLLKTAMDRLRLSARAYDRILKVARTIADLEGEQGILDAHIAEAIQYRSLDREGWLG